MWVLKTEPSDWSWEQQLENKITRWDGVRNFQARNNLRSMNLDDLAFFYHTGKEKRIVGLVKVVKTAYLDLDPNFLCVDVEVYKNIGNFVTLKEMRNNTKLSECSLLRQGRLSVVPLSYDEFAEILYMSKTTL